MDRSNIEIKTPPILFKDTQKTVKSILEKLDGDFITYWVSGNSRIVGEDIIALYEVLKRKKTKPHLYFYVKSDGGNGQASLRLIHLLRQFYNQITAFVPLDCASAATMLVLGANEIRIGPLGYLSAIDTSIVHDLSPLDKFNDKVSVSQNELTRVMNLWLEKKSEKDSNPYNELYKFVHPLVFGAVDRASSLSIKLTTEILSYHMDDIKKAEKVSNYLNSEYPSHGYPITLKEAQRIGLHVNPLDTTINDLLLELNGLYSEMAQLSYTDYDEINYHDNEIVKFLESDDTQFYYQKDKDWHYRADERRWVPMHDESSWRINEMIDNELKHSRYFIQ